MMASTIKIMADQNPALKMSPITEQLLNVKDSTNKQTRMPPALASRVPKIVRPTLDFVLNKR